MAIFTKKSEWEHRAVPDIGAALPPPASKSPPRFGITGAIALLKSLPAEDKSELVVRVMRATLASLDVHLPDVIEDATRRGKGITERIAAIHVQMADIERELENHRREIATLEIDLKETTAVKERLEHAEKTAALAAGSPPRLTPPPLPSPRSHTPTPEDPTVRTTHESFKD